MSLMEQHLSNDINVSLPAQALLDALGARLSETAIDAASWQVAQQETQRRAAEQIASLTEALQQRDQKLHATSRLIEELLANAAESEDLTVSTNYQFLRSFVEGAGLAVQIPPLVGKDAVRAEQEPAADAGITA